MAMNGMVGGMQLMEVERLSLTQFRPAAETLGLLAPTELRGLAAASARRVPLLAARLLPVVRFRFIFQRRALAAAAHVMIVLDLR